MWGSAYGLFKGLACLWLGLALHFLIQILLTAGESLVYGCVRGGIGDTKIFLLQQVLQISGVVSLEYRQESPFDNKLVGSSWHWGCH